MTIHKIETWENGNPGSNSWISVCGEIGDIYGSNFIDNVTCPECVLLHRLDSQFDEFAALPQTAKEGL